MIRDIEVLQAIGKGKERYYIIDSEQIKKETKWESVFDVVNYESLFDVKGDKIKALVQLIIDSEPEDYHKLTHEKVNLDLAKQIFSEYLKLISGQESQFTLCERRNPFIAILEKR